jgi:hypothetical protein
MRSGNRERDRERNRESGAVRGVDAGGYRRDDKGRKEGLLDQTKDGRYLRKSEREAFGTISKQPGHKNISRSEAKH